MIEYCPTLGPVVVSSMAPIRAPVHAMTAAQILKEETLTRIPDATVVPIGIALDRIKTAGQELSRANPHPRGHSVVGIRSDALEHLTVVIARTQERQRSLEEKDLPTTAQDEIRQTVDNYARFSELSAKIRNARATAEEVFGVLRSETDSGRSRMALLQKATKRQTVRVGNEEIVSQDDVASNVEIELPAADRYRLQMTVQSVNTDTGDVNCKLIGGENLDRLFFDADVERRVLHFRVVDEALFLLSLAASVGAVVDAAVAIRMLITPKGFSYRCTLIGFHDAKALASDLHKAVGNRYARLEGM